MVGVGGVAVVTYAITGDRSLGRVKAVKRSVGLTVTIFVYGGRPVQGSNRGLLACLATMEQRDAACLFLPYVRHPRTPHPLECFFRSGFSRKTGRRISNENEGLRKMSTRSVHKRIVQR